MSVALLKDFVAGLKRRSPFDRMEAAHVAWLADHLNYLECPKDSVLLNPGMACDALYFIFSGGVQMEAMGTADEERKVLAELVEGESFPLEALEENRPVFSTFRTTADTICFRLPLDHFRQLKDLSVIFSDFCRYRAASFLDQSRRVYRLHFSHQSEEQQRLSTPLSLLMHPHPLTAEPATSVHSIVASMSEQDVDYTVIVDGNRHPLGIFTMRDLLRKVVVPGEDLNLPVAGVMTPFPKSLPVSALGYEAALMLAEEAFHHVLIIDGGCLAGVVTERELFNLQRVSLSQINAEIASAKDLDKLRRLSGDIQLMCENMVLQGVTSDQLTQIISTLNDRLIERALNLELADRDLRGIKVAWIALGSEGRFEQTFSTDQDNGIIFEAPDGTSADDAREVLLPVARRFNEILDFIGFPLCKGNIMAGNPECCLSFQEWQGRFLSWIRTPTPEALLKATIFFDFRHLYGESDLSDRLRRWLADACIGETRFLHLLTENALLRTPPIGFFRDFVVENHKDLPNSVDMKLSGITLFVDAARVFALATGVTRGNTRQRLMTAGDLRKWPQSEVNAWSDAFSFLQSLRIRHQLEQHRNGGTMHNRLNPYELNNLDRKFFLESLRQAGALQKKLGSEFVPRSQ